MVEVGKTSRISPSNIRPTLALLSHEPGIRSPVFRTASQELNLSKQARSAQTESSPVISMIATPEIVGHHSHSIQSAPLESGLGSKIRKPWADAAAQEALIATTTKSMKFRFTDTNDE